MAPDRGGNRHHRRRAGRRAAGARPGRERAGPWRWPSASTSGGSCVNWGCTPSKAMIASSRLAAQARRASEWGIRIPRVEVDFAAVMDRARGMAEGARGELEKSLSSEANLRLVRGHARLDGREGERFRLRVGGDVLLARSVVLDTGTRSARPPIEGLDDLPPERLINSENWIDRRDAAGARGLPRRRHHRAGDGAGLAPLRRRGDDRGERRAPRRAGGRGGLDRAPRGAGSGGRHGALRRQGRARGSGRRGRPPAPRGRRGAGRDAPLHRHRPAGQHGRPRPRHGRPRARQARRDRGGRALAHGGPRPLRRRRHPRRRPVHPHRL